MKHARRRVKGARVVREIVRDLQEQGIGAEAQPLSGALGGRHGSDVLVPVQGEDWKVETKSREDGHGFKTLHEWLPGNRALFLKQNFKPVLVVMSFDDFCKLARLPMEHSTEPIPMGRNADE